MVRRDERESCALQFDAADLDVPAEVDVVEVQEREEPGVRPSTSKMGIEVHAAEPIGEDVGDQPATPLVEIAEQDLRVRHTAIMNPRREPRLLARFAVGSTKDWAEAAARLITNDAMTNGPQSMKDLA